MTDATKARVRRRIAPHPRERRERPARDAGHEKQLFDRLCAAVLEDTRSPTWLVRDVISYSRQAARGRRLGPMLEEMAAATAIAEDIGLSIYASMAVAE